MKLANPPVTLSVLEKLAEAGEPGILAGDLCRLFDYPAENTKRQSRLNSVLNVQRSQGHVRRGEIGRSTFYRRVPVYRWHITDEGRAYLADGGYEARVTRNARRRASVAATREVAAEQKAVAMREVIRRAEERPGCHIQRDKALAWGRTQGVSWEMLGMPFGISRERVRQIVDGPPPKRPRPCRCPECAR